MNGFISPCVLGMLRGRPAEAAPALFQRLSPQHPIRDLENAKWKLWHGRSSACFGRLAHLAHWFDASHVKGVRVADAVRRQISDLIDYLRANCLAL